MSGRYLYDQQSRVAMARRIVETNNNVDKHTIFP